MEAAQAITDYELERGKPMPSKNHAMAQTYLAAALLRQHEQEYSILTELSLELAGRPLTPDLCIYPKLTTDWLHDQVKMTEPPLMVVEILSPKQVMEDLIAKAEIYFEAGVKSCWLVLPMLKSVAVLVPDAEMTVHAGGEVVDPATGISVKIAEIFR